MIAWENDSLSTMQLLGIDTLRFVCYLAAVAMM